MPRDARSGGGKPNRAAEIQHTVDNYAKAPRENARKLRALGMTKQQVRAVHRSKVGTARQEKVKRAPSIRPNPLRMVQHTAQDIAESVGLGGAAHPVRRAKHLGGDQKPEFKRALTTTEFERYQKTGAPPLDALKPHTSSEEFPLVGNFRRIAAARRAAKTARKAGAKTYTRPRTEAEAKARLAELDRKYDSIIGHVAEAVNPHGNPRAIQLQRNKVNSRLGRGKHVGTKRQPTVSQETRRLAESKLDEIAARNPAHPTAKRYVALRDEREKLRDALNERAFDGRIALGEVTEKMSFPAEMPNDVRRAAHLLAASLDKKQVKELRKQQDRLHSAERGRRAQIAEDALRKHAGTPEALRIAKSKLAGELPKVDVQKLLGELDPEHLNTLRRYVHEHEGIPTYDKINVEEALEKTLAGRPPTDRERALLQHTFGKTFTDRIEQASLSTKLKRGAEEVANVPRSVASSFDVSAPLRQGLVAAARHPVMAGRNVKPMLRAVRSDKHFEQIQQEIARRPNYGKMRESGLALTDLGPLEEREDFFRSNLAEVIPGVRASGRAYTSFLNKTRADMFDKHLRLAQEAGYDIDDPHLTKSLAKFINSATGRGDLKALAPAAKALNATLFSPRLLASRINFLNPAYYARLHPYARKQALRSMVQLTALVTGILEAAHLAGASVELDPRSSDWAKIKIGNTRIDLLGGFQPIIRTVAQVTSGQRKTTTTGEIVNLGSGFGDQSRIDVLERFFRGKLAPVPSIGYDVLKGETFLGEPVTAKGETLERLIPFAAQDAADVHRHEGGSTAKTAGAYGLAAFGVGVQSYEPEESRVRHEAAKRYREFGQELNAALDKHNVDLDKHVRGRIPLRFERVAERAKLGKGRSYEADVRVVLRHGWISPGEARETIKWARSLPKTKDSQYKLASAVNYLNRHYFDPDGELSKNIKWLRENGAPNLVLPPLH